MICLLSSDWLVVPTQSDGSFYTKPRNNLQLNADKSDVMTLGTAVQLRSVAAVTPVDVAGSPLPVKPEIQLGVIIDSNRRFDKHAAAVAKACNNHTYTLCGTCGIS